MPFADKVQHKSTKCYIPLCISPVPTHYLSRSPFKDCCRSTIGASTTEAPALSAAHNNTCVSMAADARSVPDAGQQQGYTPYLRS